MRASKAAIARCIVALLIVFAAATSSAAQATAATTPTILFMCPHGAAKSLMASAYFQKLAKERGLNVHVDFAGTEPEEQLSKGVVTSLQKDGYTVPNAKPRAATAADMARADIVVSMGCDLSKLPAPKGTLKTWNVPDFSANFDAAEESIRQQVIKLVDELAAERKKLP
ncbi:MAG TPA: hypothetical protein VM096_03465 [Vicinamibacterales bacterium]|nr:hypothetical protein [Vicinamibacterales bacterium]